MAPRIPFLALVASCSLLLSPLHAEEKKGLFDELGLKGPRSVSQQIYEAAVDRGSITNGVGKFLLATDEACRKQSVKFGKSPNQVGSLAGAWLEYSVMVVLHEKKLTPCYYQAELKELPNNVFDVFLWTKEHGPVVLSCKTSLRERYKQADLEGLALSKFYPDSRSILVTLDHDKNHVGNCREKIVSKEITGLTAIYDETNIDELIQWLAKQTIVPAPEGKFKKSRVVR